MKHYVFLVVSEGHRETHYSEVVHLFSQQAAGIDVRTLQNAIRALQEADERVYSKNPTSARDELNLTFDTLLQLKEIRNVMNGPESGYLLYERSRSIETN
jgi:hypothetical protein